jgi:glycosyltransferase involved in cell wall biosynthesis
MPTRGPAPYLAEALGSIAADGHEDVEVIVVEDGTNRVSAEEVRPARLLRLPYVGRAVARNVGVQQASAPSVAFLDADDVSLPGRFERERSTLEWTQGAVLCFGRIEAIGPSSELLASDTEEEQRRVDDLLERGFSYRSVLADCPIYTSGTMVDREAFLALGGYDVRFDGYEDLELYLRLARRNGIAFCGGDPVAQHRRHGNNTGSDHLYACALRLAEAHLATAADGERDALLERRVDSLWGLGDFAAARRSALSALASEPSLLRDGRFAKRLGASLLPLAALRAARRRRSR